MFRFSWHVFVFPVRKKHYSSIFSMGSALASSMALRVALIFSTNAGYR
jgi:hypothetical protein